MASKEAVKKGLEKVKSKFEDNEVKNAFKGLSKSVQFVYPDINFSYILKITDGTVTEGKKVFLKSQILSYLWPATRFSLYKTRKSLVETLYHKVK